MPSLFENDTFQEVKNQIFKRNLPVTICWEFRDAYQWSMELEEHAGANRFRVSGDGNCTVGSLMKHIDDHINAYKRRK